MAEGFAYDVERSFGVDEAEAALDAFLAAAGLTYREGFSDAGFEVTHGSLFSAADTDLASGGGKGARHQVGAKAEAIEHYVFWEHRSSALPEMAIEDILTQPGFRNDHYLRSLAAEEPGVLLRVLTFKGLDKQLCMVPAAYVDPELFGSGGAPRHRAERYIGRFCSTTGGALGLSFADAALHGINEVVERHYEALLYQHMLGVCTRVQWYRCGTQALGAAAAKLARIEADHGPVKVLCAPTLAGSFVAFAFVTGLGPVRMAPIGAGSSYLYDAAVQRAVDELAQCVVLALAVGMRDGHWRDEDERSYQMLAESDSLRPLIDFSSPRIDGMTELPGSTLAEFARTAVAPEDQLQHIVATLEAAGCAPIFRIMHESGGLSLVQAFVPDFDKFFVIRRGNLVAPLWAYKLSNT